MRLYLNNLQALGVSLVMLAGFGIVHAQQPAAEPAAQKPAASAEKARVVPVSTAKTHTKSGTSNAKSYAKTGSSAGKAHASSGKASSRRRHTARKGSWKRKGQQAIQPERAREIQEALIREHYLTGEPTGTWDARTEAAMLKYQADNGWQSKVTPDSRALIKLGLGPDYSKQSLNSPGAKSNAVAAANSSGGSSAGTDK